METDRRREALEQAYRDYSADVYRVTYAILRDPEVAADAMQDAFGRAFEHWDEYDSQRPLRPWLHAIATRRALDLLRWRKVRSLALPWLHVEARQRERFGRDPADALSLREGIERELQGIAPRARAALILRHYYGYPYADIAKLLGTSPGTVGSLISRAHTHLRARLVAYREMGDDGSVSPTQPDQEAFL
ncbi:MAG: RNA polymerase sigma factor [Chloroflexota bacterium]|nr:RNA polymerase sigma factor [Chloroflexota bacterium]